ncbi:MAG: hypothetical protein DRQ39_00830 [Gammaproteobacteria bacterium]|nr:MAG: hypothetical protein DRQ39_00830 [Gammaproteobacteria bacterium]
MATAEDYLAPVVEEPQNPFENLGKPAWDPSAPTKGAEPYSTFANPGVPSRFASPPSAFVEEEAAPYLPTEIFSLWGIVTRNDQVSRVIQAQVGNPEVGMKIERIIQQNPTASPEIIAGLAYSGQLDVHGGLLDEIIRQDALSQDSDMWLWNALKNTSRNLFIVAEDAYNLTPGYVVSRTAANTMQGHSLSESLDLSLKSSARTSMNLSQLGVPTYEGDGFIPSVEMTPQSPTFWAGIQESIDNNTFEGSPEEQLIKAVNQEKLIDMQSQGFNTFAFATQQWESTLLHKTLNDGTVVSAPLSYGSMVAMPFTTPGTRAYDFTSASFDMTARLIFEPTDILFDSVFRQLGRAKALIPDEALFGRGNFRSVRSALNETFDINLHLGAVPEESVGRMSVGAREEVAGVTGKELDEFGSPRIDISATAVRNQYEYLAKLKRTDVWDAADPYAQGYIDAGFDSPSALLDEVNTKGGLPGHLMLNIEHELVHSGVEIEWYKVVETDEGRFVDYNQLSDKAPQELRDIAADAPKKAQGEMSAEAVAGTRQELSQAADDLAKNRKRRNAGFDNLKEGEFEQLIDEQVQLESKVRELTDDLAFAEKDLARIRKEQAANMALQNAYVEQHATRVSAENMRTGKWSAPEVYKAAKAKAGIIQTWRPWVNPKLYSEWLMGKKGQKILDVLAEANTYDKVDNVLKGQLTPQAKLRIAETNNRGEIANIIGVGMRGTPLQRPKIGRFYDLSSSALDSWESSTVFSGGQFGAAARRLTRRAGAQGGHNVLSVTDPEENLQVISSLLRTAGVDEKTINRIQKLAIRNQGSITGLSIVNEEMMKAVVQRTKRKYGAATAKEVKYIEDQWRLAEQSNRIYRTDSLGNVRGFYHNGKMYLPDPDDANRVDLLGGQAAQMESQFVTTSIVTPNARQIRRLTSQQRRAYEAIRRTMPGIAWQRSGGYLPLGLESSTFMRAGDWSFGIWRDFALMRFGWSFRILPEEHLRAAASGYSTMFNNPIDYFISLQTKMDMVLPGEHQTIAEAIGADGLGTAVLRAMDGDDAFVASKSTWVNASFETSPDLFWAGTTRAYVSIANDEITSRIARDGYEKTLKWLKTDEGQVVVDRVAKGAATDGGLDGLKNSTILRDYVDSQNLYIAEHTGGGGVYKDRRTQKWFDSMGEEVTSFRRIGPDGNATRFNDRQSLIDFIMANGGEKPLTKTLRPQLEQIAADLMGYDIDELENLKRVAHVSVDGNADLRSLMGNKTLDEINIDKDMPFDTLRTIDNQLKEAFATRDITPHHSVPVPADELVREGINKNQYRKTTDAFFKWFNAVPSTKMNRSPVFNQAMGYNVALQYAFATPEVRKSLDTYMAANESMRTMFGLGKKKVLKDWQWKEFPEAAVVDEALDALDDALIHIDNGTVPDSHITDANHVRGQDVDPDRYSLQPLVVDADNTLLESSQAFWEKLAELGMLRGHRDQRLGTYAHFGAMEVQFDGKTVMQGGAGFFNPMDEVWDMPTKLDIQVETALANKLGYQDPVKFKNYVGARSQDISNEIYALRRLDHPEAPLISDEIDKAFRADIDEQIRVLEEEKTGLEIVLFEDDPEQIYEFQQMWARNNIEGYPTADELKTQMADRAQEIYDSQKGKTFEDFGLGNNLAGGFTFSMDRIFVYIDMGGMNTTAGNVAGTAAGTTGHRPTMGVYFVEDFSPSQIKRLMEHGDLETSRTLSLYGLEEIDGFDSAWSAIIDAGFPFTFPKKDVPITRGTLSMLKNRVDGYRQPGLRGKKLPDSASDVDKFMFYVESMRGVNMTPDFGEGTAQLLKQLEIDIDAPLDELREAVGNTLLDNKFMAQMFGDEANVAGYDYIVRTMEERGVKLTDENKAGLKEMWESHVWEQTEISISDFGVKPVALFEKKLAQQMLDQEIIFTSNQAVGDVAQFMDTYLEDVTGATSMMGRQFEDVRPDQTVEMVMDDILDTATNSNMPDIDTSEGLNDFIDWLDDSKARQEDMWAFESTPYERAAFDKRLHYDPDYDPGQTGDLMMNYADWIDSDVMRTWFRKVHEGVKERSLKDWDHTVMTPEEHIAAIEHISGELGKISPSYGNNFDLDYGPEDRFLFDKILSGGSQTDHPLSMSWTQRAWSTLESDLENYIRLGDEAYDRLIHIRSSSMDSASPFFGKKLKQETYHPEALEEIAYIDGVLNGATGPVLEDVVNDMRGELLGAEYKFATWMGDRGRDRLAIDFSEEAAPKVEDLIDRVAALADEVNYQATPKFNIDLDEVPFAQRQETTQRQLGYENYRYNWMETGSPQNTVSTGDGLTPQRLKDAEQVEVMLKGAKEAAIEEVKDLFYDLSNKSNIADAYRLLFPFGDAWYEVLSRWAKIMNPAQSGSQPFRNVRRLQVGMVNARKEGFLSTNEYGEEVFNWPGLAALLPGPLDGTPAGLSSQMPLSSLLFVDPSARGIAGPSMSPWAQLGAQIAQPTLDKMPVLRDMANFAVYGGGDEYMPGKISNIGDIVEPFMPTVVRRMWGAVFSDDNRNVYGNTKMRLFESLLASGDMRYNAADPAGMREAWRVANEAGTWLSVLRIVDSWFYPGQPQYQPELKRVIDPDAPPGDPTLSIIRLANEYRHANDLWGRAEADLYMIERFGINPVVLQGMTAGYVEQPSTWEAVNYFAANRWILDLSPITAAAVIPRNTESFSQRAWQNQSIDRAMIDGVEGPTFRGDKNAYQIGQAIQRSQGYEQLRAADADYNRKVDNLRRQFGFNYASSSAYRLRKKKLDKIKANKRADIMAQYPVVESLNAGDILGETQGSSGPMLLKELTNVGTEGTEANMAYRKHIPEVAKVAETLTRWFSKLEKISRAQEQGTASPIWWLRSETDEAVKLREMLAKDIDAYLLTITDEQAHDYAVWMAKRIIDPLLKDWEWIKNEFAPQIDSYPTILLEESRS